MNANPLFFPNGYAARLAAYRPTAKPIAVCTIRMATSTAVDIWELLLVLPEEDELPSELEILRPPVFRDDQSLDSTLAFTRSELTRRSNDIRNLEQDAHYHARKGRTTSDPGVYIAEQTDGECSTGRYNIAAIR